MMQSSSLYYIYCTTTQTFCSYIFVFLQFLLNILRIYIALVFWIGIMGDSSASYIHMVQHLIEKCLIFNMTKEECMEALSKHANIEPVITSTVWKELEKENKEFFEAYAQSKSKDDRMSEEETSRVIQRMISQQSESESSKDHDPDK
ncbi:hypothetical protein NC651_025472 [Populus alba x Populus x berolinensis]|nr:hypothetical protein NC651_025472 [Populus alba x Populus x berolinensis]